MKIRELIADLQHIESSQGDIDVVLQDDLPNKHPKLCKHGSFFVVEESTEAPHDSDCSVYNEPAYPKGPCDCLRQGRLQEVVLRTWPY